MRCVIIFVKYLYFSKEALIKSDVQITPSDCAKAVQEPCRISSGFCAIWREIFKKDVHQSVCCDLFRGSLIKFGAFALIPIAAHFFRRKL